MDFRILVHLAALFRSLVAMATVDCRGSEAEEYRINIMRIKRAVFDIDNLKAKIWAEVDNDVRLSIPFLKLDKLCNDTLFGQDVVWPFGYLATNVLMTDVFSEKALLQAMNVQLAALRQWEVAIETGEAQKVLQVTDLFPDKAPLQVMNIQLAAWRQQEAVFDTGEAQKVLQVKAVEAGDGARFLAGQGLVKMWTAIAEVSRDSMLFRSEGSLDAQAATYRMIITQYLDILMGFNSSFS